jgi:vacuolar-type H+-ATPase subunit I/STV1
MTTVTVNPNAEAIRAHVAARVDLLASCSRAATQMDNSATNWARAELVAIAANLTDRDAIQRAVCEKFPKVTGNGKISKTPSAKFKTSFDKFVMLDSILRGEHKTYSSPEAMALAVAFRDGTRKLTLNDVVEQIKDAHAAASRSERANETEADKQARKAREEAETVATIAGATVNSGATMLELARRIGELDADAALAYLEPITKLMQACEAAVTLAQSVVAPAEQKLAA